MLGVYVLDVSRLKSKNWFIHWAVWRGCRGGGDYGCIPANLGKAPQSRLNPRCENLSCRGIEAQHIYSCQVVLCYASVQGLKPANKPWRPDAVHADVTGEYAKYFVSIVRQQLNPRSPILLEQMV